MKQNYIRALILLFACHASMHARMPVPLTPQIKSATKPPIKPATTPTKEKGGGTPTTPTSTLSRFKTTITNFTTQAKSSLGLKSSVAAPKAKQNEFDLGTDTPIAAEAVSIDGVPIVKTTVPSVNGVSVATPVNNPRIPADAKATPAATATVKNSRFNPFAKSIPKKASVETEPTNETTIKNKDGSTSTTVVANDGTAITTTTYPQLRNPLVKKPNLAVTTKLADGRTTTQTEFTDGSKIMDEVDAAGVRTISEYSGNKPIFGRILQTKTYKQTAETVIKPDPANPGKNVTTKTTFANVNGNELPSMEVITYGDGRVETVKITYGDDKKEIRTPTSSSKPQNSSHNNSPKQEKPISNSIDKTSERIKAYEHSIANATDPIVIAEAKRAIGILQKKQGFTSSANETISEPQANNISQSTSTTPSPSSAPPAKSSDAGKSAPRTPTSKPDVIKTETNSINTKPYTSPLEILKDNPKATPQEILGVNANATAREITTAYRKLSLIFHPDKNSSPLATENFQKMSDAYQTLQESTSNNSSLATGNSTRTPQSTTPPSAPPAKSSNTGKPARGKPSSSTAKKPTTDWLAGRASSAAVKKSTTNWLGRKGDSGFSFL